MVEVAENELAALKEKLATKESQVRDARGGGHSHHRRPWAAVLVALASLALSSPG